MMNYRKILSVISAGAVLLSNSILLPAHAEYTPRIVILGDSISTGQSLGAEEKSYVQILEEYTNVEVQNFAQEGYTTADVLELMSDPEVKKALSYADAVIIAVGEHDIMDGFIDTANDIIDEFGVTEFLDIFTAALSDFDLGSEEDMISYSNRMASAVRANRTSATQNILDIDSELEEYSDANIIWMTMYNFLDTLEGYEDLTFKRQKAYDGILNPAKNTITSINGYIEKLADNHEKFTLVDVYSAFEGKAYQYTNLYQLDFNPNAEGHALIADLIIQEAELEPIGDVNGDQLINASDASEVLKHAASIGANTGGTLDSEQAKCGDVDGNGCTDARDAAQILYYAAVRGIGGSCLFHLDELPDELVDPDPTQPDDEEFVDPDPTQPDDEEFVDPDPTQPDDEEFVDPDPTQPDDLSETETDDNP